MRRHYVWKTWVCPTDGAFQGLTEAGQPMACPTCGEVGRRPDPVAPLSPTVLSDELWGGPRFIENLAPEPVWVETKSQYRAACAAHGFENRVQHVPVPGSDTSPHTTTWDIGPAPGRDPRPFSALSAAEQVSRRAEAAERFGMTVEEVARVHGDR